MELHQIRYFLAVCGTLNFTRAAEHCHVSQPSLTRAVKKLEDELLKMQKLESVGVLAGGIAHDFNNNLQSILSCVTLAKSYANPEDEVYKRLEEAKKVVFQSKSLTQQLLTFSKGGEPVKNTTSVSKLIKD